MAPAKPDNPDRRTGRERRGEPIREGKRREQDEPVPRDRRSGTERRVDDRRTGKDRRTG
ncbi:MAG: hypothetical protein IH965_03045 [Gemmatimonadetes bacterium]|nr:hypothetical protein [Gemmatimonadota bacterium]